MFKPVMVSVICAVLTAGSVTAQGISEADAWDLAKASRSTEEVFAFMQDFPNGEYARDAKLYMIDLLWSELEAPAAVEESDPADATQLVAFSRPLTTGSEEILGKTIEELLARAPLFPPIEGLPEELWKEEKCTSCHAWQKASLCTQAEFYLSEQGSENLSKQHPYGGSFKVNLRDWAQSGCE